MVYWVRISDSLFLDMAAQKGLINLLPQEEFLKSTQGRLLTWALTSFRIIVILTEMIVMVAFLSRFWLDARVSDLNDEIKQKQSIILAQRQFETQFRALQDRLKIFASLSSPTILVSKEVSEIASRLPQDIVLSNFSYKTGSVQIRGEGTSEQSIAQLIANLSASDAFEKVILSSVTTNAETNLMTFSVNIIFKK